MNVIQSKIAYLESTANLHTTLFQNKIINKFASTPRLVDNQIVHDISDDDILQLLNIAKVIKDCLANSDGEQYDRIRQIYISKYFEYFLDINGRFRNPQEKVVTMYERQCRDEFTSLFDEIERNLARGII